jgi:hypothetical protein
MHISTRLATLVNRGDAVSIEQGRLAISPPSGESLPAHWLQAHTPILLREILAALSIEAYEYISYTTGFYGRIKAPPPCDTTTLGHSDRHQRLHPLQRRPEP